MPGELQLENEFPKIKGGRNPSAEFAWKIFGATDYLDAYASLYAHIIANVGNPFYTGTDLLSLQDYGIEPIIVSNPDALPDVFRGTAQYGIADSTTPGGGGPPQQPGDPPIIEWDTQGATAHITQAIAQRDYGRPGETPPDFEGAIGVTADGVEGVDIPVPHFKWSERYTFWSSFADFAYAATVVRPLTGATNTFPFRGFDPLDVTFLGARGSRRGADLVDVTYQFEAGRTVDDLEIGDIAPILKLGSEYLWTTYVEDKRGTPPRKVLIPKSVHVAAVKEPMDFEALGIGE